MKIPQYLEKILNHMAECEERHGGLPKKEAYEIFRSELINESLTAKANPKTLTNPTVKPFVDIYILIGKKFAESPLGKSLGFKYKAGKETISTGGKSSSKRNVPANSISRKKINDPLTGSISYVSVDNSEGKKFIENMRNFAVNVANEVTRAVFGERTERAMNYLTYNKMIKNWLTASGGEYVYKGEKSPFVTKSEHMEQEAVELVRYRKLAIQSLIVGLLEPLFELTSEDIDGLIHEFTKNTPLKDVSTVAFRRQFQAEILELMRDRNGIVKASVEASEYVGLEKKGGGKVEPTFINLTVELARIKKGGAPLKVVPPKF